MEESQERDARRAQRQVQDHLIAAHKQLGAHSLEIDFVEAIYHPTNSLPDLNYLTPRRRTAWIPKADIQRGMEFLTEHGRTPRVQYIEGLFPPLFAKQLIELGLQLEQDTPLMIYRKAGLLGTIPPVPELPTPPDGVRVEIVKDQRGVEMWWYVWRNAHYDVLTLGVEPLHVGRDMAALHSGQQIEILLHRYSFPVGVARVSIQDKSAHLVALALMSEVRTDEMSRLLYAAALKAAVEQGCELIFAPGATEQDRKICRLLGFVDSGSMVCYAARKPTKESTHERLMAEPVLTLR
jgi:hypothetical protein